MKDDRKHEHYNHNGTAEEKALDASNPSIQRVDDTTVVARGDFKHVIGSDHYNETELPEHHKFNETGKAHPQYDHGVRSGDGGQSANPLTLMESGKFP